MLGFNCVKIVQIRRFFWSVFCCILTENGDLRNKSLYSVQIKKNTDQKKLCTWKLFTQCFLKGVAATVEQILGSYKRNNSKRAGVLNQVYTHRSTTFPF